MNELVRVELLNEGDAEALNEAARQVETLKNEVLVLRAERLALHEVAAAARAMLGPGPFGRGFTIAEKNRLVEALAKVPQHSPAECSDERTAIVQGSHSIPRGQPGHAPGIIAWSEQEKAWEEYARRYGSGQSAARIHERGGFGYGELKMYLGHEPKTWRPR